MQGQLELAFLCHCKPCSQTQKRNFAQNQSPPQPCDQAGSIIPCNLSLPVLVIPYMRTIIQATRSMQSFRGSCIQFSWSTPSSTRRLLSSSSRQIGTSHSRLAVRHNTNLRTATICVSQARYKSTYNNNNKGEVGPGGEQPPVTPLPKTLAAANTKSSQQKQEPTGYDQYEYGGGAPADAMGNIPYSNSAESNGAAATNPRMVSFHGCEGPTVGGPNLSHDEHH